MKTNIFTTIRFILALLTVLAVVAKPYIPPKTLPIHPAPATTASLYGVSREGNPVSWIDQESTEWRCDYKHTNHGVNCGLTFTWNPVHHAACAEPEHAVCTSTASDPDGDGRGWEDEQSCRMRWAVDVTAQPRPVEQSAPPICSNAATDQYTNGWGWENGRSCQFAHTPLPAHTKTVTTAPKSGFSSCYDAPQQDSKIAATPIIGIDFSKYDGLNVKIHYEGRAKFLRLYLRNHDPHFATNEQPDADKFISAYLRTEDLKANSAYVDLSEFTVAEWWITATNAPRHRAALEFDNVATVGIDHIEHGLHKMRVDKIELVGERISMEKFLMGILVFWAAFLLLEGAVRYYQLSASSRLREAQICELSSQADLLEQEKTTLQARSVTDALTGAFNRAGAMQQLYARYGSEGLPSGTGLMMLDIDHFKKINDTHGHDVGDRVLKSLANLVNSTIRNSDIFARWGGEEFIIISPESTAENVIHLAEKLRKTVAAETFESGLNLSVTLSIGVAKAREGDTFDIALKRADVALYKAKITRNSVAYYE